MFSRVALNPGPKVQDIYDLQASAIHLKRWKTSRRLQVMRDYTQTFQRVPNGSLKGANLPSLRVSLAPLGKVLLYVYPIYKIHVWNTYLHFIFKNCENMSRYCSWKKSGDHQFFLVNISLFAGGISTIPGGCLRFLKHQQYFQTQYKVGPQDPHILELQVISPEVRIFGG